MYIVGLVKEEICSYKKKIKFRISGEKMAFSIPIPLEKIEEIIKAKHMYCSWKNGF